MTKRALNAGAASVAIAATLILAQAAAAQSPQPAPSAAAASNEEAVATLQQVVVTGTSVRRSALTTPMQTTTIGSDQLQQLMVSSPADVLSTVPMLKAEGGGGEVAANIFVAGLPSPGQYQFTPIEFNGVPVIGSIGLNSSAPDIYERPDLGVERLEFVHGGVSNLFGGGSVGGLINYIDQTGGGQTKGEARLELGDLGLVRTDFTASGPINKDAGLYYALSGWYRYDEGPLKSGMPSNGYQIRGNIKKEFEGGNVTFYGQYIDDVDQFYADYPLNGQTRERPNGNDGKPIYTTETSALKGISYLTPNGEHHTKVGDGVAATGGQVGLSFQKDLGDGWGVNGRGSVGSYHHSFALFAGGDNVQNLPTTQAAFLQAYGYNPANYNANFTFANNGRAVPANYLLWGDRVIDRIRPLSTATGELNVTKKLNLGGWEHHFSVGGFWGHTTASDINYGYSFLSDFDNAPQLIDLTVTNKTTGAQTIVTRDGLLHAGLQYTNNWADARRYAGYAADQISVGKWELDIGFREEHIHGEVSHEGSKSYAVDNTPGLSPLLANVQWGNDQYLRGSVDASSWALAGSVLYRVNADLSVFVNASRGFFMPNLNGVQINSAGVGSYQPEIIKQVESGAKLAHGRFSGSMSVFYSTLDNLQNVTLLNGPPGGGVVEVVNLEATRTYGVEGAGHVRLTDWLTFDGDFTYEHGRYTQYSPVQTCTQCVGHEETRQPDWMANGGLYVKKNGFDASIYDTYTGRTFTSDLNNIELPGNNIVRLDGGYTLRAGGNPLRIGFDIYNLLDSQAPTEGSPRLGTLQNAGQAFFVGRTVLPRRIRVEATYKF